MDGIKIFKYKDIEIMKYGYILFAFLLGYSEASDKDLITLFNETKILASSYSNLKKERNSKKTKCEISFAKKTKIMNSIHEKLSYLCKKYSLFLDEYNVDSNFEKTNYLLREMKARNIRDSLLEEVQELAYTYLGDKEKILHPKQQRLECQIIRNINYFYNRGFIISANLQHKKDIADILEMLNLSPATIYAYLNEGPFTIPGTRISLPGEIVTHILSFISDSKKTFCHLRLSGSPMTNFVRPVLDFSYHFREFYFKAIEEVSEYLSAHPQDHAKPPHVVKGLISERKWNETQRGADLEYRYELFCYSKSLKILENLVHDLPPLDINDSLLSEVSRGYPSLTSINLSSPFDMSDKLSFSLELAKERYTRCCSYENVFNNLNLVYQDPLTDAGINYLSSFKELTRINLSSRSRITDQGIQSLSSLSNLTSLDISYCSRITLETMGKLKALTSLSLYIPQTSPVILSSILTSLKNLEDLKELRFLKLGWYSFLPGVLIVDQTIMRQIIKLTSLEVLDLSEVDYLRDHVFSHIGALTSLKELQIGSLPYKERELLENIAKLLNLTSFSVKAVYDIKAKEAILNALVILPKLRYFNGEKI